MNPKRKKQVSFSASLYISIFVLIVAMTAIMAFISTQYSIRVRQDDLDQLITTAASAISESPRVREMILKKVPDPVLTEQFDKLTREDSELDIIVICDKNSVRFYHTNHDRIGQKFVGGDQDRVLGGETAYISVAVGTLGLQRRAFHAVLDEEGNTIGFVMVSVLNNRLEAVRNQILGFFVLILIVVFFVGLLIAAIFQYHLQQILLGYHPEDFVNLYIEREEVLNALEEGLYAIDKEGKVTLINAAAKRLLGLDPDFIAIGQPIQNLFPDTLLPITVQSGQTEHDIIFDMGGNHLLSSRIPVRRNGRIIGAVAVFQNKTEVTHLAEELMDTKYMVDTLRAVNHEFMNKLHVILGLLEVKELEQAKQYILHTTLVSGQAVSDIHHRVPISSLAALLIGKMIRASELGITFVLKQDSYFHEKKVQLPADCYITLVGNLLENAIDELNSQEYPIKRIELGIYSEEGHTTIVCDDTGGGIPEEILFSIYDTHTTTKGEGHGNGYKLMKAVVDQYEGTFHIDTEPGEGTSIEILLPI